MGCRPPIAHAEAAPPQHRPCRQHRRWPAAPRWCRSPPWRSRLWGRRCLPHPWSRLPCRPKVGGRSQRPPGKSLPPQGRSGHVPWEHRCLASELCSSARLRGRPRRGPRLPTSRRVRGLRRWAEAGSRRAAHPVASWRRRRAPTRRTLCMRTETRSCGSSIGSTSSPPGAAPAAASAPRGWFPHHLVRRPLRGCRARHLLLRVLRLELRCRRRRRPGSAAAGHEATDPPL